MFVWIIKDRLAKCARDDDIPAGASVLCVAHELKGAIVRLHDDDRPGQERVFTIAVTLALQYMTLTPPAVVMCHGGWSRSVTVACLAAALWQGRHFFDVWNELREKDPQITPRCELWPLAEKLFPNQFLEGETDDAKLSSKTR